jgi:PhzF family phenazine biosynthesis protein
MSVTFSTAESLDVLRLAAFADGDRGGNPAGVVIAPALPDEPVMQGVARSVGFSETVFATPMSAAGRADRWRVRYFAPEQEIPFCGHATIALGAALAARYGDGTFTLALNEGTATVQGAVTADGRARAALHSPPATTDAMAADVLDAFLELFALEPSHLDARIVPAFIMAGARHVLLPLVSRAQLACMTYDLAAGRALMRAHDVATVCLVHADAPGLLHVRNAFAAGGVLEDPATGAAAAALAGHLRRHGWPHDGDLVIRQGDDMGVPCRLVATMPSDPRDGVRVSGTVRWL